ncbi:MAG: TetR/AcrR family transcriptional regulator [Firmicutes bacterium]|nr:TetR/AcrR family transcriptional regulator [Bacillota bacterium]
MSTKIAATDRKILKTARTMILEKGILETDMKDIAAAIGMSRSTLYRHFPGKADILLKLADEALSIICKAQTLPSGRKFDTGYDAFAWQMGRMTKAALDHIEEITFLRDFDCLYGKYCRTEKNDPEGDDHLPALSRISPLKESFQKGVEDQSIRPSKDPELQVLAIFQSFLAVAERVLPEEAACRSAYGYGREILLSHVRTLLSAIKS